jgi:hypothetical protein
MKRLSIIEVMKNELIECDIETVTQSLVNGDSSFLADILGGGWVGYHQMTDEQIMQEYRDRELDQKK